ncbi:DUF2247 family protein [Pseudomonas sp. R151218B TE3479]
MSPFKILSELGLVCWSTIFLGFRKGWVKRSDVFDYAIGQLMSEDAGQEVALIAGGEYLSDEELLGLIEKKQQGQDTVSDLDKWRLAFLLCIGRSGDSEENKVFRLQEVYADFDYPEDMALCSVYSQGEVSPLVAMSWVVKKLQGQLLSS